MSIIAIMGFLADIFWKTYC